MGSIPVEATKKENKCLFSFLFKVCLKCSVIVYETAFNPTIDAISVVIKNKRKKVAGSLKKMIPTNTLPTAPIPVQTAYAVPMGRDCVALINNDILIVNAIRNKVYHIMASLPTASFAFPKQKAKATSKRPAIMRINQFMQANVGYF